MSDTDEFITHLQRFGLTEQEAQLYFRLLASGPTTSSSLTEVLSLDHEDINRMLTTLIENDMVRPSLQSPTKYAAVELDVVLEAAMQNCASELQDVKARRQEFVAFSRQHPLHPSADVSTFKMLRNVREIASVAISTLLSTEEEFLWIAPKEGLELASTFGINNAVHEFYERGGSARGITDITAQTIPLVQELLDIGEEVRHFDGYRGMYYGVFDRRHCMSAINIDVSQLTPDTPARALYTEDSLYAQYLLALFELLWKQSVSAEERIQELLERGAGQS